MRTKEGQTIGETFKDTDHLDSHLEESYFVPSLLAQALDRFPISDIAKAYLSDLWAGTNNNISFAADIATEQIGKSLKRYIYRQYGFAS